ncbi:hypothetical protein Tco_0934744 [Tanacetum coccineum]
MEAHCIALELKYQNQALKSGQHGQILNETSNKKEIDVLETMNIELEHSLAKLLKKNETLKKHYKDLYDFIKIIRSKNIEQTTSLLANNADLKAQIQEKVFAIAALKYGIWKLKGNSVDTKFTKTSVLGKPFSSQVDVNNNLSRLVTQHYLPKRKESAFSKLDHMIASSSSRNSSKNMPGFSSNDMVHNHYLEEAKKKTQEINKNSKSSLMQTASPQTTTKEVNSHEKTQFNKIRNTNKPVEQKSHTQKPIRQIFKGHKFSPNKTSDVYEKTSLRHDLRWKPTGRIFKPVGLRWVPTGKILASCTSKADSESTHGSNVDISKIYECKQTLDLSAGTSINVQKEKSFATAGTSYNVKQDNLKVWLLKKLISQKLVMKWIQN